MIRTLGDPERAKKIWVKGGSVTITFSPPGGPPFKKGGQNIAVAHYFFTELFGVVMFIVYTLENVDFVLGHAMTTLFFRSEVDSGRLF